MMNDGYCQCRCCGALVRDMRIYNYVSLLCSRCFDDPDTQRAIAMREVRRW